MAYINTVSGPKMKGNPAVMAEVAGTGGPVLVLGQE